MPRDDGLATDLRTKIWNRNSCKNKSSNNIIWGRLALAVCWNKPSVTIKFDVKFQNVWIPQYFDCCIIPSIFLWYEITETNALSMTEWNWKEHPKSLKYYRLLNSNLWYIILATGEMINCMKSHNCYLISKQTQKTVHQYR